ncbi:hypothetical protein EJP617_10870 [Erwinia sp. Ejp617]|nr:hypothetical protein EJP617_10870 [Erwinia sp. Ejp617]
MYSTYSACRCALTDYESLQFAKKLLSVKNVRLERKLQKINLKIKRESAWGDFNKQVKYIEIKSSLLIKSKKYKFLSKQLSVIEKCREKEVFVKSTRTDESDSPPRPYAPAVNPNADLPPGLIVAAVEKCSSWRGKKGLSKPSGDSSQSSAT